MNALTIATLLGAPAPAAVLVQDSILAACETAQRVAHRVLTLDLSLQRHVEVRNDFAARPSPARPGCRLTGHSDDDRIGAPVDDMYEALRALGWEALLSYQADGPDGSVTGFIVGPALCIVRGSWDGGDDADTTYVPVPGYDLEISCFRRTAADDRN